MRQPLKTLLLLITLAMFAAPGVGAASEIVLCIDEIQGESQTRDDCMDVQSWSWSVFTEVDTTSGSTRTRSRPVVEDLTVVKETDSASPNLLLGSLQGKTFASAELVVNVCLADCAGRPVPLVTISLKNVAITRVDMGGLAGERPTESVSLTFEEFEYCYQAYGDDGAIKGETCSSFDIQTGV